jgi:hypothetical protein
MSVWRFAINGGHKDHRRIDRGNLVGFGSRPLRQRSGLEGLLGGQKELDARDQPVPDSIEVRALIMDLDTTDAPAASICGPQEKEASAQVTRLEQLEPIVRPERAKPVPEPLTHRLPALECPGVEKALFDHEHYIVGIEGHCPLEITPIGGGELIADDVEWLLGHATRLRG